MTLTWGVPLVLAFRDVKPATGKKQNRSWHWALKVEDLNYSPPLEVERMMGTLNLKLMMGTNIFLGGGVGMVSFQRLLETSGGSVS